MDELQIWECNELCDMLKFDSLPSWEQTRQLLYAIVQVNSKKKIKANDLIKFAWDEEYDENKQNNRNIEITNEEIKMLAKKAQKYIDKQKCQN